MKFLSAAASFLLFSSNTSIVSSSTVRGAVAKKDTENQDPTRSLWHEFEDFQPTLSEASAGKANGKNDNDSNMPAFLRDDELPPGLVDNPSQAVGVDFKSGKSPKSQKVPNLTQKKAIIRGLDNKPIKLDLDSSERVNVYHPDQYTLSSDGSYVTDNETGDIIKLTVFHTTDHKSQYSVLYSLDEDGLLTNVRVTPTSDEDSSPPGLSKKDAFETDLENKGKAQNFQRLDNTDVLVGYTDDDVDQTNNPSFGDAEAPEEDMSDEIVEDLGENRTRRRRAQATSTQTRFGKTCTSWDWLDVRIATDKKFNDRYGGYSAARSRAQAVFAEAAEIYWKESCVWLWMWSYESTVSNSNWITPNGQHLDTRLASSTVESGCGGYGALQIFRDTARNKQPNAYRDVWHLFSGANFSGNTIGCAWINVCKSKWSGYGVNEITFTTNLRYQAVLFAHELGHNLGLNHLGSTNGYWVMEPSINFAPWDLTPTNAGNVRNKVVNSSGCGWY